MPPARARPSPPAATGSPFWRVVAGHQPVRALVEDRVDLVESDEVTDLDRPRRFGAKLVELLLVEGHVTPLADLEAHLDVGGLDLLPGLLGDLPMSNARSGALLQLWKWTSWSRTAVYAFTGMLTKPKVMVPDQIGRAMNRPIPGLGGRDPGSQESLPIRGEPLTAKRVPLRDMTTSLTDLRSARGRQSQRADVDRRRARSGAPGPGGTFRSAGSSSLPAGPDDVPMAPGADDHRAIGACLVLVAWWRRSSGASNDKGSVAISTRALRTRWHRRRQLIASPPGQPAPPRAPQRLGAGPFGPALYRESGAYGVAVAVEEPNHQLRASGQASHRSFGILLVARVQRHDVQFVDVVVHEGLAVGIAPTQARETWPRSRRAPSAGQPRRARRRRPCPLRHRRSPSPRRRDPHPPRRRWPRRRRSVARPARPTPSGSTPSGRILVRRCPKRHQADPRVRALGRLQVEHGVAGDLRIGGRRDHVEPIPDAARAATCSRRGGAAPTAAPPTSTSGADWSPSGRRLVHVFVDGHFDRLVDRVGLRNIDAPGHHSMPFAGDHLTGLVERVRLRYFGVIRTRRRRLILRGSPSSRVTNVRVPGPSSGHTGDRPSATRWLDRTRTG